MPPDKNAAGDQAAAKTNVRLTDTLVLVVFLIALIFAIAEYFRLQLSADIDALTVELRDLGEQDATLGERLSEATTTEFSSQLQDTVPHPRQEVGNPQFIGDHAEVSWQYSGDDKAIHMTYEIEVTRSKITRQCKSQLDYLQCQLGTAKRFIATDPQNQRSRVPPAPYGLADGTYMWRVSPVPPGTIIPTAIEQDENAVGGTAWSSPSYFTLYSSIVQRVLDTHRVRVGINMQHDSSFSRFDDKGNPAGFEISLIYSLIQGCIKLREDTNRLQYDSAACGEYFSDMIASEIYPLIQDCKKLREGANHLQYDSKACDKYFSLASEKSIASAMEHRAQNPAPTSPCSEQAPTHPCVQLVQIANWSDWQTALKHKQVDLFIGSVTSAADRKRNGLVFTDGYLRYETRLYVDGADIANAHGPSFNGWLLGRERRIGVIKGSSNEKLLDLLSKDRQYRSKLVKIAVDSYPELESAMDGGQVDGVLIDDTFVNRQDWIALGGLKNTPAWREYHAGFLGSDYEDIAIATILGGGYPDRKADTEPAGASSSDLYQALHQVLSDRNIRRQVGDLCAIFWPPDRHYDYRCQVP